MPGIHVLLTYIVSLTFATRGGKDVSERENFDDLPLFFSFLEPVAGKIQLVLLLKIARETVTINGRFVPKLAKVNSHNMCIYLFMESSLRQE